MKRSRLLLSLGMGLTVCFAPSLIHPWGAMRGSALKPTPILTGSTVPFEVRQVLETKCGDCHSDNTHWPLYSRVAPVSWLVERDVHDGRKDLNLSHWTEYGAETKLDLLGRIASEARTGRMPLASYLRIHPEKRLSSAEQQLVYDWARAERKRLRGHTATAQ